LTGREKPNQLLAWKENGAVYGKPFAFLKKPGIAIEETVP